MALEIPPLRERRGDIQPLVEHFVRKHRALNSACGAMHPGFLDAVSRLPLPGNARQLENLVCRALVHNDDGTPLGLRDLPPDAWTDLLSSGEAAGTPSPGQGSALAASDEPGLSAYPARLLAANSWNLSQ